MTIQSAKLVHVSHDLTVNKNAELLRLFPEVRPEGRHTGFHKLKIVPGECIDVGRESYGIA